MSWDALRYFDELGKTRVTTNRLPHWEQAGASFFLTFRLADSLPGHLVKKIETEKATWLARHPEPWDPRTEAEYHRLYSAAIDRLLDAGHGHCLLSQEGHASIVSSALQFFDRDRYWLHSFVVMPNHVHLLFTIGASHHLPDLVRSWKRHTAREINKLRKGSGSIWQRDYFDRIIRDSTHFVRVVRYIRGNVRQYPAAIHHESDWIAGLA